MGTVTKALTLLNFFSESLQEIGLSELSRLAKRDKATTFRLLTELCETGFAEQNPLTKNYRLGPALLRLANVREQTIPVKTIVEAHLERLVQAVQESSHATLLQGQILTPICKHLSAHHGTRVFFDDSETLPLHATASGCAVLAYSDHALLDQVLSTPLDKITEHTTDTSEDLIEKIEHARTHGFGSCTGEFELGVSSIAAPLFGPGGACIGAVSVAYPSSRHNAELAGRIRSNLAKAASNITEGLSGTVPPALTSLWNKLDTGTTE